MRREILLGRDWDDDGPEGECLLYEQEDLRSEFMFKTRHTKINNDQYIWVSWCMLVMSVLGSNRRLTAVCW